MTRPTLLPGAAAVLLLPASLAAQTPSIPLDNGSIAPPAIPTSAPIPLPTPAPQPTPAPTSRATPTPRPTPTASPTPRAAPTSTAPVAEASPTPEPSVTPTATPTVMPTAAPSLRPPIETVVLPQQPEGIALWPWLAGGAVLLLALAALLWRRRAEPDEAWPDEPIADSPEPLPEAAPPIRPAPSFFSPAPPLPAQRPAPAPDAGPSRLAVTLRPTRAGLNMLTATVEADVTVANAGDVAVTGIRANVLLFGAHHADEPDLARIAAAPAGRPVVPPFTLAAGAHRQFRAVAALPLDAIAPLQVAGRPMFVPIVVVHLRWADADGERAAARAWAVGVDRAGAEKLAPLWLDTGPQSFDRVAVRPHGDVIGRLA